MTSPDVGAVGSPIAALLRRALIALGVAAAFVVAGLLLSGDRAQAAEQEDAPGLVGELLSPVTTILDGTVLEGTTEIVDAVVAPVDEIAAPVVEPVLDRVVAVLPTETVEPVATILPEVAAEPTVAAEPVDSATAPPAAVTGVKPSVAADATATGGSDHAPRDSHPHPSDAVVASSVSGSAAVVGLSATDSADAPRLADSVPPALPAPPAAPDFASDSTPD